MLAEFHEREFFNAVRAAQTASAIPMKEGIIVNTRSLTAELSGVQRYVGELCARLGERLQQVAPARPLQGIKGHLWEQCWLPTKVGSRLL
jgi:hypothetical protein